MRTRFFWLLFVGLCLALRTCWSLQQTRDGQSQNENAAEEKESHPVPLLLDDAALPLSPNAALNEAQRDKVEALSLFAAARAREDREQYSEALRLYQRALHLIRNRRR